MCVENSSILQRKRLFLFFNILENDGKFLRFFENPRNFKLIFFVKTFLAMFKRIFNMKGGKKIP